MPGKTKADYTAELLANYTVQENGCWHWGGYVLPNGYGQLGRNNLAHRLSYEHFNGARTPGLSIDHVCHTNDLTCPGGDSCLHRRCINPAHLEEVTTGENIMRGRGFGPVNESKFRCPASHLYTDENTYYRPDRFGRMCRICRRERLREYALRNRESCIWQQRELRRTGVMPKRSEWPGVTPDMPEYQPRLDRRVSA
jgi:hypothetical protein